MPEPSPRDKVMEVQGNRLVSQSDRQRMAIDQACPTFRSDCKTSAFHNNTHRGVSKCSESILSASCNPNPNDPAGQGYGGPHGHWGSNKVIETAGARCLVRTDAELLLQAQRRFIKHADAAKKGEGSRQFKSRSMQACCHTPCSSQVCSLPEVACVHWLAALASCHL